VDGKLVLSTPKFMRGKEVKAGTVIAEITCVQPFTVDDVNIGMQLNQVGIAVEEKKQPAKDKEKK